MSTKPPVGDTWEEQARELVAELYAMEATSQEVEDMAPLAAKALQAAFNAGVEKGRGE